jgi:hypothetical protein
MIFFLLLTVMHSGYVIGTQTYLPHPLYAVVFVKTCDGEFSDIYSNKKLTTPMPNPFNTDDNGHYRYFTTTYSEEVTIMYDGKSTVYRNCVEDDK